MFNPNHIPTSVLDTVTNLTSNITEKSTADKKKLHEITTQHGMTTAIRHNNSASSPVMETEIHGVSDVDNLISQLEEKFTDVSVTSTKNTVYISVKP